MNSIFAYRLKSARILNGLSLTALAEKVGISKQMISKYEKAKSLPDGENLIALANALNVKPDYFFNESKISLENIKFRKKAKASKKQLESLKVNVLNKMENYLIIEEILNIKSDFVNPLATDVVNMISDVEQLAIKLRKEWNIGLDPIVRVVELLESNEIKVIEIEENLNQSFDGLSDIVDNKYPLIVSGKTNSIERKRFTLLHELGHLLLKFSENIDKKAQEKFCDRFAGAVLMPDEIVFKEFGIKRNKISIDELKSFQNQYGISIAAILYRLKDLNIISESKLKQFFLKRNKNPHFKEIVDKSRYQIDEKTFRYKRLINKALSQQIISISKASSLLNTDIESIEEKLTII